MQNIHAGIACCAITLCLWLKECCKATYVTIYREDNGEQAAARASDDSVHGQDIKGSMSNACGTAAV